MKRFLGPRARKFWVRVRVRVRARVRVRFRVRVGVRVRVVLAERDVRGAHLAGQVDVEHVARLAPAEHRLVLLVDREACDQVR